MPGNQFANETERKFAAYVDGHAAALSLAYEYEPTFEGHSRHPDFMVHAPGRT